MAACQGWLKSTTLSAGLSGAKENSEELYSARTRRFATRGGRGVRPYTIRGGLRRLHRICTCSPGRLVRGAREARMEKIYR